MADNAYISAIKLPNNETYLLKDLGASRGDSRVFNGTCATAAATALKEVICPNYDKSLTVGDILIVKFTYTNSASVSSLQLTIKNDASDNDATTAKNIKKQYNSSVANLTAVGEIRNDTISMFIYNGTYWLMFNTDYNSNDEAHKVYASTFRHTVGSNLIYKYGLFGRIANGSYETFAKGGSTGTKTKNSNGFLPNGKIYYYAGSSNLSAGIQSITAYEQYHSIDYRYTFNISTTSIPAASPVYIKFIYDDSDGLLYLADNWFATTLPTSADNFIYQHVGNNYYNQADYRASLLLNNPYYKYENNAIRVWTPPHRAVTSISPGVGLTTADGNDIVTTGTIKANLVSETPLTGVSVSVDEVATRIYPVALDNNNKLAVNVPWTENTETKLIAGLSDSTSNAVNNTGEVYLRLFDGSVHRSNIKLVSGNTNMTIISDANGTITFTSTDTTYSVFAGSSTTGGLVPIPSSTADSNNKYYFLRADGSWAVPQYFTLSAATSSALGGIKIGYSNSNEPKNYAVQLDSNNKAYVNVPWTDSGNDKVTQTDTDPSTTNTTTYKILFSNITVASDTGSVTDTTRKSSSLIFNPSTATLQLAIGNNTATISPTNYSGNAATATVFASEKSIVLTGDVTGSDSDTGSDGWSIATTISDNIITDAMINSNAAIANSKLANYQISIAGNTIALGGELTAATLTASLGLSNALHFIGFVDATSTYKPSDGTTKPNDKTLVITGLDSYTPQAGDVIIDDEAAFEYVYTSSSRWERLGGDASYKVLQTAVTDSNASTTATTTFVQAVTQNENGEITVTKAPLNTSGTWSGTATKWTNATIIYVNLSSSGTNSTLQGGESSAVQLKVDGTLPIARGGTNATSVNKYGVVYGNSSSNAYASTSTGTTAGQPLIAGGSNAAPGWYGGLTLTGAGTSNSPYIATMTGHIVPGSNNTYYLGDNTANAKKRWKGVYIGSNDSYGNPYTPIYWDNGVPAVASGNTINVPFTIANGKNGVKLSSTAFTASSYIIQIVVDNGISYLNDKIISTHAAGEIKLQLANSNTVSGAVSGYIIVAIGSTLPSSGTYALTPTDIS